jgi:hypothetical protein
MFIDAIFMFVYIGVPLLVGVALIVLGANRYRAGQLIRNTPPEKVRSVAIGRTELRGKARDAGVVFDQPFTEGKCLYYKYEILQYSKGEQEDNYNWEPIHTHQLAAPFMLDDGTDEILVAANGGADVRVSDRNTWSKTFDGTTVPDEYQTELDTSVDISDATPGEIEWEPHNLLTKLRARFGMIFGGILPIELIPGTANDAPVRRSGSPEQPDYEPWTEHRSVKKRRIRQEVIPVDEDVYVYGKATERGDSTATQLQSNAQRLFIQGDDATGQFILSDKTEEELTDTYIRLGIALIVAGILLDAVIIWQFFGG